MQIRFDPRAPIVWRDPSTLQIGVDRPALVLTGVSRVDERVIAAIAAGHGVGGLPTLVAQLGLEPHRVASAVDRLRPALVPRGDDDRPAPSVHVGGSGPVAHAIGHLLTSWGARVSAAEAAIDTETPLSSDAGLWGVLVGGHVVDPVLARSWLRRGLPHLLVRVGDLAVHVGPVTIPGETACARCLHLDAGERDGAWPAMAGQLARRDVPAPPLLSVHEAATSAVRRLTSRMTGCDAARPDAEITTVSLDDGRVTRSTARLHPDCGCAALPRND